MKNTTHFENMGLTERNIRFVINAAAIIGEMQTGLVGSPLFAVINVIAIAVATTAIIGWDPLKSLSLGLKSSHSIKADQSHGHHA